MTPTTKTPSKKEIQNVLKECETHNKKHHCFTTLCKEEAQKQKKAKGTLSGIYISVKDNICVKDVETTAGSHILKGYLPKFDATTIQKLKEEGATIIGKTSCDAFGFGSFNTNVGKGFSIPKNPHDTKRTTGGSSGGSAAITQLATFPHVSLAESTGGSIACPASFCGIIGLTPTYGRVSRYGLIPYANSLDKIGIMSKKVSEIEPILKVISGFDEKDGTSLKEPLNLNAPKKLRIGIIKESYAKGIDPEIQKALKSILTKLKQKHTITEISLPLTTTYGVACYYILATSEASTNLACLSGLRYGQELPKKNKGFNSYFTEVRTKSFNQESKRRIMIGTFTRMAGYRDAYYIKATKVRTKIIQEYKKAFKTYDVLISPTMPFIAPTFSNIDKMTPLQNYLSDILTVGSNLAGLPHASIPIGKKEGMPIGLLAITDHLKEGTLLQTLKEIEALQ
ncbi:Asp-tRNA(Asn)/Glu-tRNA(Gln) amidotransferase GatCAB subunit A [Candidatus Woesearchaeota archaeon]|mgnify:CR=1 FL=1|nr:Asp-tRNA(Asn)/Glu-tRNA(Gln) amidotransferase GatCAB subunit A [Candidatus Woesearchaeota archaeon]